jgi:hypothetical protein
VTHTHTVSQGESVRAPRVDDVSQGGLLWHDRRKQDGDLHGDDGGGDQGVHDDRGHVRVLLGRTKSKKRDPRKTHALTHISFFVVEKSVFYSFRRGGW